MRHDINWVRRTFRINIASSLGVTFAAVVPSAFIARPFIKLWTGGVVVPPLDLVIWMSAWSMINALCSPIACLLAAAAHMKAQVIYSAISAAINPASIDIFLLFRKLGNAM